MQQSSDDNRMSKVTSILQELRGAAITFDNFKRYLDKVEDANNIIEANVENLKYEYNQLNRSIEKSSKKESNKTMRDRGYVPIEDYENATRMNEILRETVSWKTFQNSISNTIYVKLGQVLEDTKGMEIQRDALDQMKEMERNRQEVFKENFHIMSRMFLTAVSDKLRSYDEKFMKLVTALDKENRSYGSQLLKSMNKILESSKVIDREAKDKISKEFEESANKHDFINDFEKESKEISKEADDKIKDIESQTQKESKDDFDKYFETIAENSEEDNDTKSKAKGSKRGPGRPRKNSKSGDDIDSKMDDDFEDF